MLGSPKFSVSDRVGLCLMGTVCTDSVLLGTVQAALGGECKKAFIMASAAGAIGAVVALTGRSYTKLDEHDSTVLSQAPCEASWVEKKLAKTLTHLSP